MQELQVETVASLAIIGFRVHVFLVVYEQMKVVIH